MPVPTPTSGNPEMKTILHVYGVLVAALLLSFVPDPAFAIVATIFFLGVWIAAYIIRKKAEEDSLTENHMIWIIRTLWITCLFSVVTITAGGLYLWSQLDYSAIQPCSEQAANYLMAQQSGTVNATELMALMGPCEDAFLRDNQPALILSAIIAALPLIIYLVMRLTKGLSRAVKGYRLASPKSWF